MAERDTYTVEIRGDDKLSHTLKGVQSSFGALSKASKIFGAIFVTGIVAQGFKKVIGEAAEAEKINARLEQTLKNVGQTSNTLGKSFENLATQIQELSGYSDEDLKKSMSDLMVITGDASAVFEHFGTVVEFARGANLDLDTATKLLGRAYKGNTEMLQRLGIYLEKGTTGTEVFEAIQKKFAGSTEKYMGTVLGQWDKFKNNLLELAEKLGTVVLPPLNEMLKKINQVFSPAEQQNRLQKNIDDLTISLEKLNKNSLTQFLNKGEIEFKTAELERLKNKLSEISVEIEKPVANNGIKKAVDDAAEATKRMNDFIENTFAPGAFSAFALIGQAIGETAAGATDAWQRAGVSMLISVLDFAEKSIQAAALVGGATLNVAQVIAAGVATMGIEALKAGISYASSSSDSETTASTSSSTSTSTNTSGTSATTTSSSGGGGQVINIYNATFISDNGIIEFFNKAKSLGYEVIRTDYGMA